MEPMSKHFSDAEVDEWLFDTRSCGEISCAECNTRRETLVAIVRQLRSENAAKDKALKMAAWNVENTQEQLHDKTIKLAAVRAQLAEAQRQRDEARVEIARLTAVRCECGHVKTDHDFFEDHDECRKCPSDGPPNSCSEFRPQIERLQ